MDNIFYDKLLNIKTCVNNETLVETANFFRYEATDYDDLGVLLNNYIVEDDDCLVDFGCGLGRVPFFIHSLFNCKVKGIEYNRSIYIKAEKNKLYYNCNHRYPSEINFYNINAVDYEIEDCDNVFYFFNPFSINIFSKVVSNILESVMRSPREVDIVLYYPDHSYIYLLENQTYFYRLLDVELGERTIKDDRERFVIYRYNPFKILGGLKHEAVIESYSFTMRF